MKKENSDPSSIMGVQLKSVGRTPHFASKPQGKIREGWGDRYGNSTEDLTINNFVSSLCIDPMLHQVHIQSSPTPRIFQFVKQEKLGDTKSDSWLIIRTLDGLKFDIMAHNRRELYHSSYFIKKLQRPSARIHMYQEKRNRELLKYVGEPKEIVLHEKYDEAHSISGMLKIKFEAYAEERLQENIPTNLLEYHTLFKNKDITKIVSQVLMDSFLKYDHDLETMNTFVYLIDKLAQKTRREINEGFAKSPLTERNFTIYTRNALIVIIRKELHNIINTSISKNFGTNTDFYEMLFVKRALMSI